MFVPCSRKITIQNNLKNWHRLAFVAATIHATPHHVEWIEGDILVPEVASTHSLTT
jgi:hypothetical protein